MTSLHARISSLKADPLASSIHPSLDFYYGDGERDAALDRFYRRFVSPGDLVFDIGAHVGDHIACFRRLGARVVAVEPQPLCGHALRTIYADDPEVTLVEAACGAEAGPTVTFYVNSENPTVSTVSPEFVRAADGAGGWEGQVWDSEIQVPTVTFDGLIREHGTPAFTKIDVEGFEESVLAGLTTSVRALSFEFTTIEREVAQRALERAAALGFDRFNVSLGGNLALEYGEWVSMEAMGAHLAALPHEANSGDVYCLHAD
ncbi:FkbM family methyltransferase [Cryptosporangium phraense]|uniref:FkbM family methyltransferase n=1 Tax=Cryptosporangium phraense TaxID=2593070 RepID=A0A545ANW8_9ACTN|nr:FkbM family methyltransferase [Cryptosporangium phraense]TQS43029.1 FkbM family methyltransferase [Cryptosporangium phraense]